jgi:hypothetical protein
MKVDTTFIAQYDITDYNLNDILASRKNVFYDTTATIGFGQMQYGVDGKLYICDIDMKDSVNYRYAKDKIGVIDHPDSIGTSCNYLPEQLNLDGRLHSYCLPNFVSSYFNTFEYYDCNTDVQEFQFNNMKIEIFPNPATDFINIKSNISSYYLLKIFNITGRLCQEKSFQESLNIDLHNFLSGLYIIQIYQSKNHSIITRKIIKL